MLLARFFRFVVVKNSAGPNSGTGTTATAAGQQSRVIELVLAGSRFGLLSGVGPPRGLNSRPSTGFLATESGQLELAAAEEEEEECVF